MYQQKVNNLTKSWEHNLTKEETEQINKKEIKQGKVYANVKTDKENNPYRFIVSSEGTAIDNLARSQNFLEDSLTITMTSNTVNFMGRHFTQIDGATIGGPESASVTYIYGAVFIDCKIEENSKINEDEDWKRYRDDSFSISLRTCEERETEKTKWRNENIVKIK